MYLTLAVASTLFIIVYFPESPKYLYSKGQFVEARESIQKIAVFNGVTHHLRTGFVFKQFKFEKEVEVLNQIHRDNILNVDSEEIEEHERRSLMS